MKKKAVIPLCAALLLAAGVIAALLLKPGKSFDIRITVPAGSGEAFAYSDEQVSPKRSKITLACGEGLGDCEVVLKPIEGKEENAYEPAYMTPGMPVKMEAEKGAWFQVGVRHMQDGTGQDRDVYVTVTGVDVRIE